MKQTGAALVVSLILLVALGMMAVSSMSSATLDLVMAGNEQYRTRAFVAAETGIQRAVKGGTFNSSTDVATITVASGAGGDTYSYGITRPNNGVVEVPPAGHTDNDEFGSIFFRINATGASERNTRSVQVQEVYEVVKSEGGRTCDPSLTSCDLYAP